MLDLDVKQIIIQIIAFLVMFWVIKKFGWRPLLDVLKGRQEKMQREWDAISMQKEEAKNLALQYEEKLRESSADARKKIQEAIAEGHKISVEMQKEAQINAREIVLKAKLEIEEEVAKTKQQLKNDMVTLIVNTTEKILRKTLDDENQKKLIADFVEEAQLK